MTISAPVAPELFIIFITRFAARRTGIPLVTCCEILPAIINGLSSGFSTSSIEIFMLANLNLVSTFSVSSLMPTPLLPITRPGLKT